jgi:hypothetical protein
MLKLPPEMRESCGFYTKKWRDPRESRPFLPSADVATEGRTTALSLIRASSLM